MKFGIFDKMQIRPMFINWKNVWLNDKTLEKAERFKLNRGSRYCLRKHFNMWLTGSEKLKIRNSKI